MLGVEDLDLNNSSSQVDDLDFGSATPLPLARRLHNDDFIIIVQDFCFDLELALPFASLRTT